MMFGSVCSGIEAASVAWHPLGWRAAFVSEIEPFPRAVLAHRFPTTPLHGDFTTIGADDYGAIDLLVGGTPCQSFSVAGLRGGLADDRGNLALEFLRLAKRKRPRWLVWENVPGVLSSSGGRDFGAILGGLVELGYGFAYRVLDAQYFGVAQRRRRVFVVGYLGDWRPAAAVLFERASLSGHPAPRRQAGQKPAPTLAGSSNGGGANGPGRDADSADSLIASTGDRSHCLNAGGVNRQDYETETLIAHALRAEGFDASEDGTGRGAPLVPVAVAFSAKDHGADAGELAPTLRAMGHGASHANGGGQVAVAFAQNTRDEVRLQNGDGQIVGALAAEPGMKQTSYVAFDTTQITSPSNYSRPQPGDPCHPLAAGAHPPAIATTMQVRRLTPRECERLQGFPDDWTLIPWRGKPAAECPDGPRYKALGNSMAVPCMRWIGARIAAVESQRQAGIVVP